MTLMSGQRAMAGDLSAADCSALRGTRTGRTTALLVVSGIATLIWMLALARVDVSVVDDLGLISAIPYSALLALTIVVGSLAVMIRRDSTPTWAAATQIALLAVVLYGGPAITEEVSGDRIVYRHLGIISHIADGGAVDGAIDAYFNWPGFFIFFAFLREHLSLGDAVAIAPWAPLFFNLLYLPALTMVFAALGGSRRVILTALAIFLLANWAGQDYLSPQAFGYLLYLVTLGVLLTWYRGGVAPRRGPLSLVGVPERPRSYDLPARHALGRMALVIAMFGVLVVSHQLTPFLVLGAVLVLCLFGRLRLWGLLVLMGLMLTVWLVYGADRYLAGHLSGMLAQIGGTSAITASGLSQRVEGSPDHVFVAAVRLGISLTLWTFGLVGWFVRRERSRHTDAVLLMLAPFATVLLQSYGGEIGIRVFLFSLPFAAFLTASLIDAGLGLGSLLSRIPSARLVAPSHGTSTAALAATLTLLAFTFTITRYGNARLTSLSTDEVATLTYLTDTAPDHPLLVLETSDAPYNAHRYAELKHAYVVDLLTRGVALEALPQAVFDKMAAYDRTGEAYLVLNARSRAYLEMFGYLTADQIAALESGFRATGMIPIISSNDATVYVLPRSHAVAARALGVSPQLEVHRVELAGIEAVTAQASAGEAGGVLTVRTDSRVHTLPLTVARGTVVLPLERGETAEAWVDGPDGRLLSQAVEAEPASTGSAWGIAIAVLGTMAALGLPAWAFFAWPPGAMSRRVPPPPRAGSEATAPVAPRRFSMIRTEAGNIQIELAQDEPRFQHLTLTMREQVAQFRRRLSPTAIRPTVIVALASIAALSGAGLLPGTPDFAARLVCTLLLPGLLFSPWSRPLGWLDWVLVPAYGLTFVALVSMGTLYLGIRPPGVSITVLGLVAAAYGVASLGSLASAPVQRASRSTKEQELLPTVSASAHRVVVASPAIAPSPPFEPRPVRPDKTEPAQTAVPIQIRRADATPAWSPRQGIHMSPPPSVLPEVAVPQAPAIAAGLKNGDFSSPGGLTGWVTTGGVAAVISPGLDGEGQAVLLSSGTDYTKWLHQLVTVSPWGWYSGSARLKLVGGAGAAWVRIAWYATASGDGPQIATVDSTVLATTDVVVRVHSGPVRAPEGARSARVRLMLRPLGSAAAAVIADDVHFQPVGELDDIPDEVPSPSSPPRLALVPVHSELPAPQRKLAESRGRPGRRNRRRET